jgi:hypothetical protein
MRMRFAGALVIIGVVGAGQWVEAFPVPEDLVDTTAPRVSQVAPDWVEEDVATAFTITVTDDEVVESCRLYIDGDDEGSMTIRGTTASRTETLYSPGEYELKARCTDEAGNVTFGPVVMVEVEAEQQEEREPREPSSPRNEPPSVGRLTPTSATVDTPVTFTVSVSDDSEVARCDLYVENEKITRMSVRSGRATAAYTFTDGGVYDVKVRCTDDEGESSDGRSAAEVRVEAVPAGGELIKMDCRGEWWINHPCTTVYYLGEDGYRHPFVNEKVFFSWYEDYTDVQTISREVMTTWEMGENVTYKPGSRLVKFPTDRRVFVVGRAAMLYPLDTETVARHTWGRDWASEVEDIAEVFYRDYTIGETVLDDDDWDNDRELRRATSPMVNF